MITERMQELAGVEVSESTVQHNRALQLAKGVAKELGSGWSADVDSSDLGYEGIVRNHSTKTIFKLNFQDNGSVIVFSYKNYNEPDGKSRPVKADARQVAKAALGI